MTLNNMFSLIIGFSAITVPSTVIADEADSTVNKIVLSQSIRENFRHQVYSNPAAQFFKSNYSLTSINFEGVRDNSSEHKVAQMERGKSFWGLRAQSQYIIDKDNKVWGEASYNKGTREDVVWNETSDLHLLYPYVMADGKGGDMDYEQYYFNGGYTGRFNNIICGASLNYRALDEYRTRDPRPNNVVADLHANIGAGVVLNKYSLNLGLCAGKYKQTNELKYFNEVGAMKEYHLTGIGNEFVRFSGTSNNVFYKGHNWGGSLELVPINAEGLSASLSFNRFFFEKVLSELNKLALNDLLENKFAGEAAWTKNLNSSTFIGIKADGYYSERKGHDNLFGDAVSNAYPKIGSILMYNSKSFYGGLSGFYESTLGKHFPVGISPYFSYLSFESRHTESSNKFDTSSYNFGALLQGSYHNGRHLLRLQMNAAYRISNESELYIAEDGFCDKALKENLEHTAAFFAKDELSTRISLRYQLAFRNNDFSCYAETSWLHRSYLNDNNDNIITLTAGINL